MTDQTVTEQDGRNVGGQFEPGHPFAHLGGEAKAANREASAATFLDQLPRDWQRVEDCQRFAELVAQLAARQLCSGSQANAAIRGAEVWAKVEAVRLDRDRMTALESKIEELEAELASSRRPRAV
jgi:hypothetical protein